MARLAPPPLHFRSRSEPRPRDSRAFTFAAICGSIDRYG
jgi:hypothetical protein